jgi:hypothetical protein
VVVHYSKNYTAMLIALGVAELALGALQLIGSGGVTLFLLFTGAIFLAAGISARFRPYVEIKPDRVLLYALVGPLKTTHPFDPPDGLHIQGDKFYVDHDGVRRRFGFSRWLADPQDWAAVEGRYGTQSLPPMNE